MKVKNNLLSVVIPAFNEPTLLERQLKSILCQTYRPIEIIISDDCSPNSIEPCIQSFASIIDSQVSIKFQRQQINLGVYWNFKYCLNQIKGKYVVFSSHDDWYIGSNFFSDAINILEIENECDIIIANAATQNTNGNNLNGVMMDLYTDELDNSGWILLEGKYFIANHLYNKLHPSYSSVVMNWETLERYNYLDYFVDKNILLQNKKNINFQPDEGFVCINLLAYDGKVAISGKVVSVRGTPLNSWSRTKFWTKSAGLGLFIPNFLLLRFYKENGFKNGVLLMLRNLVFMHPVRSFNLSILKFLNYEMNAILIMSFSFLYYYLPGFIKKILHFLLRRFKKNFR